MMGNESPNFFGSDLSLLPPAPANESILSNRLPSLFPFQQQQQHQRQQQQQHPFFYNKFNKFPFDCTDSRLLKPDHNVSFPSSGISGFFSPSTLNQFFMRGRPPGSVGVDGQPLYPGRHVNFIALASAVQRHFNSSIMATPDSCSPRNDEDPLKLLSRDGFDAKSLNFLTKHKLSPPRLRKSPDESKYSENSRRSSIESLRMKAREHSIFLEKESSDSRKGFSVVAKAFPDRGSDSPAESPPLSSP